MPTIRSDESGKNGSGDNLGPVAEVNVDGAARWISCGRHTFRFDKVRRFTAEMEQDGSLAGITVIMGPDEFLIGKGDGAESLRRYIAQKCSPVILTGPELVFADEPSCQVNEPEDDSNFDTPGPGCAG